MNPNNAEGSVSPVHGFKRDLIRLIGNLCYENKENQDLVSSIVPYVYCEKCQKLPRRPEAVS